MRVERVRVGDVLALQRRAVDVDPLAEYVEIGVRSFGKGIFHKEPLTGADLGAKRVFRIEPGDLVISNVFAWEGAVALATQAERGTIGSHRFMTFTPASDAINSAWASWFFRSEPGLERIRKASPGSAGRNRTLAIARFENLIIPLPPIEEQRRVAAHLDRTTSGVDSLRTLAERSAHLATAARAALARSTSTTETAWRSVSVRDVLRIRLDEVAVDSAATYPMAGVYSFGRGLFARGDLDGAATSYRVLHRLAEGQIVMSRLKAWEGALALVPAEYDGHFLSPEFPTFEIDHEIADPKFLSTLLTTQSFWGQLKGASKGIGARKERVHAEQLLDQQIDLPSIDEQRSRASAITALDRLHVRSDGRMQGTAALLPSAMNQAFADLT